METLIQGLMGKHKKTQNDLLFHLGLSLNLALNFGDATAGVNPPAGTRDGPARVLLATSETMQNIDHNR
jgi:hypothetical protein